MHSKLFFFSTIIPTLCFHYFMVELHSKFFFWEFFLRVHIDCKLNFKMFMQLMSSYSTRHYTMQWIIAIDPCAFEWGCTVWGWTWGVEQRTLISFNSRVPIKCVEINFNKLIFKCFQKYLQLMIMSGISPALKIGLQFFGFWPDVSYSNIHSLTFMSSLLFMQYFQYVYIFDHLMISELSNLVDGLVVALDYSLTFLKLTGLWIHRR